MGWFSSLISGDIGGAFDQAVGNVSSGIGNIVSGVESAGRSLDDIVNDIPGGWGTVAAATGIYYAPEIGEYIGASGGGLTESQVKQAVSGLADSAAAADVAGGLIPEYGSLAGYAATPGLEGFALPAVAGAGAGLTAGQLAQGAAATDAGTALSSMAPAAAAGAAGAAAGGGLSGALPYLAAGNIASGLIGSEAAKTAAQTQADAARQSADLQRYIFDTLNQQQGPYREAGYSALKDIQTQLPYLTSKFTPEDFAAGIDPGYAFRLKQGQMAAERAGNLKGMTGNVLTGLQDYTQGLASQEYANAFNRNLAQKQNIYNTLAGIAGIGQNAQGQTTQAAGTYGTNVANLLTGGAAAQAAGQVGQANALGGALGNVMNTYTLASLLGQSGKVGP